jgi:fatty-acyl-CoA synthase
MIDRLQSWAQDRAKDLEVLKVLGRTLGTAIRVQPEKELGYSDLLAPHFERDPDRPALIGESGRMSWRELDQTASRVAHWALDQGLGRGQVVALLMENRPEFIAIWLGLSRVGVVTALLNTNLVGDRLAHCMREADVSHWIVGTELLEAAASARPHLEGSMRIFRSTLGSSAAAGPDAEDGRDSGQGDGTAHTDRDDVTRILGELEDFDAQLAEQPGDPIDPTHRKGLRAGDGLFLIYTSGTTGLPKAARISHYKAVMTGAGSMHAQGLGAADRTYCCLPLYHSAGGMMAVGAALLSGGTLVLSRRFSAKRFWSDCAQHDVTSFQYIGELCRYLLNSPPHPDERRHAIRSVIGNGLRPEIWKAFQERFAIPRIVEFYGATEGNMALLNLSGKVGSVGQLPHLVRRIVGIEIVRFDVESEQIVRGPDGFCERAAFGEPGEAIIKISRTSRFEGYTNPEATEKKILRDAFVKGDAYFRTGDLLRLDEDGHFYFVDRIGDTFRWKGENVATSEVAEVLGVHPGIEEANVYGVALPGMEGRAGMAALVVRDDLDLEALSAHVVAELAPYARPLFLRILPAMEITGTFKHRKVDLVREGFDPRKVEDPIHFLDPETNRYVRLDGPMCDRILAGEIRI